MIFSPTNSIIQALNILDKLPPEKKDVIALFPYSKNDLKRKFEIDKDRRLTFLNGMSAKYQTQIGTTLQNMLSLIGNKEFERRYNGEYWIKETELNMEEPLSQLQISFVYDNRNKGNPVNTIEKIHLPNAKYSSIELKALQPHEFPVKYINVGKRNILAVRAINESGRLVEIPEITQNKYKCFYLEGCYVPGVKSIYATKNITLMNSIATNNGELNLNSPLISIREYCRGNVNIVSSSTHLGSGTQINKCQTYTVSVSEGYMGIENLLNCKQIRYRLHSVMNNDTGYFSCTTFKKVGKDITKLSVERFFEKKIKILVLIFGELESDIELTSESEILVVHDGVVNHITPNSSIILKRGGKPYSLDASYIIYDKLVRGELGSNNGISLTRGYDIIKSILANGGLV